MLFTPRSSQPSADSLAPSSVETPAPDSLALATPAAASAPVVSPPSYLVATPAATHRAATLHYTAAPLDSVANGAVWPLPASAQALGLTHQGLVYADVPGTLLGYSLRTDSWVTGTLLLTFFLAAYSIARSRHFLQQQLRDFFRLRQRANLFADAADSQSSGWFYLLTQYSLIVALISFEYMALQRPERLEQASPYAFMGVSVGVVFAYNVVKQILYAWVGHTFFEQGQRQQWRSAFRLSLLVESLLLFALLLLTVYFALDYALAMTLFLAVLGLVLVIRWYKQQAIFFGYRFGYVHGFLYFCTLEITPLVGLWYALHAAEALAVAYL